MPTPSRPRTPTPPAPATSARTPASRASARTPTRRSLVPTFRPLNPLTDSAPTGPELDIPARTTAAKAWSIVLATFPANVSIEELNAALNTAALVGVRDVYPDRRGSSIAIAYGMYPDGDDPAAREALNQIQNLEVEGKRPFATAILVPPPLTSVEGSLPDFDLATVRSRVPGAAFTLQVAVYKRTDNKAATDADLAQFRKAAEQAVMEYRREGAEAYYYHTARASTVTIGVFSRERLLRPPGPPRWPRHHRHARAQPRAGRGHQEVPAHAGQRPRPRGRHQPTPATQHGRRNPAVIAVMLSELGCLSWHASSEA
jgi:hypothetical protein